MNRKVAAARQKEQDERENNELNADGDGSEGGGQQETAVKNPYP